MKFISKVISKVISTVKILFNLFTMIGGKIPTADEFGHRWTVKGICILCACTRYKSDNQFWYTTENKKHASNDAWNCRDK